MSAETPRRIVLCADDYAQDAGVSGAIRALAGMGRLSATSAMVLSPRWREDAAPLAELRERIDVGLHLDWTSPFAIAAGHGLPLAAAMRRALLGGFAQGQARGAIERQLDAFEQHWRAAPDHVDGHQHVHQFAGIREALVQTLARRYGRSAPWLRIARAPEGQRSVKTGVIALMGANALERIAASARLDCAKWLSGIYGFDGGQTGYARRMAHWLATSPPGTVLMCHPGTGSDAAPDPIARARAWEYAHLQGADFARQLAAADVQPARGRACFSAP